MRLGSSFLRAVAFALPCVCSVMGHPKPATFGVPPQFNAGVSAIVAGGTSSPVPALTADLNHDGYGDFVTVDWTAGTVVVVLGGSQGFQNPASIASVAHPVSIAIGDFNKDGNLDLLVVGDTTAVLLGTGTGSFQAPATVSTSRVNYGAVGDFNGDGKPDIALGNEFANQLLVGLGNGDGTFSALVSSTVPAPWALYPGDFHNSGRDDLILLPKQEPVTLLTSNGDGTFQKGAPILNNALRVVAADMNQDGNLDFLTDGPTVWLGDGHGNFTAVARKTEKLGPDYMAVADVNGDGIPDVVTSNQGQSISIFLGEGGGKLQAGYSYNAGANPLWVGVGTYFGSDRADVVALTGGGVRIPGYALTLLRNDGTGHYPGVPNIDLSNATTFAMGDMNQDGILDLVVTNQPYSSSGQPAVWVLPGLGNGEFGEAIASVPLATAGASPVIADFDGDGVPDFAVVLGGPTSSTIDVALQQPGNTFNVVSTAVPVPVTIAWAGDLNGDGLPDLVLFHECLTNQTCGAIYVLLNAGHGAFGSLLHITGDASVTALVFVAVADFNHDGKPDLALASVDTCPSEAAAVLLGNGDGTLGMPVCLGSAASAIVAGDFNRDGNQDVALLSQTGSNLLVFLGDGMGRFHPLPSQSFPSAPQLLFAADLNGDGFPDLAAVDSTNEGYSLQIYLGTGSGRFVLEPDTFYTSGYYGTQYSAQIGDLNNDGKIELVTLSGAFSMLLNTTK